MFRSILMILLVAVMLFGNFGCGNKELTLATGNQSSSFNAFGSAIADILTSNNIPTVARNTEGSITNIQMLQDREVDIALVQNDVAYYAVNGIEMFEGRPITTLRGIATLYPLSCHVIVLATSPINSIDDLRGKKISVGGSGRADETNARQILSAYGINHDSYELLNLSQTESLDALKTGEIDAAICTTFTPAPFVTNFATQNPIRLLPLNNEVINTIIKNYPYYTKSIFTAGIYPGLESDIPTVAVKAMLVTSNRMYDDDVYEITQAIFQNTNRLESVHTLGKMINKDSARTGMSIQMHVGASKYFND